MKPLLLFLYMEWIDFRLGGADVVKGRYSSRMLADLREIASDFPHVKGRVRSSTAGRYEFSDGIPDRMRQRIRNVLANP